MSTLSTLEREFINRFQGGFPLTERPFARLADQLGTREDKLLSIIQALLRRGLLSRFGPLVDAERLGGEVTLAAISVPTADYSRIAQTVNALSAVAHNYRRDHQLNMWFVIASEQSGGVSATLTEIERRTGLPVYNFPRQQTFYLGFWMHLEADGRVETVSTDTPAPTQDAWQANQLALTLLRTTQAGLPLCVDPWSALAEKIGTSAENIVLCLREMLNAGVIRRIGAVPNHYHLGLRSNGMSVWDIPDELTEQLGNRISSLDFVSHCYLRPRHPGVWPYNLFAMLHGVDRETVRNKAKKIITLLGDRCCGHDILFSTEVLKKTGLRLAA